MDIFRGKGKNDKRALCSARFWFSILILSVLIIFISFLPKFLGNNRVYEKHEAINILPPEPAFPPLDKEEYDRRMKLLANNPESSLAPEGEEKDEDIPTQEEEKPWPVPSPYPRDGAILPFKRVIAYYGNLYSKKMGALGEYPEDEMFSRLLGEVKKWEEADPGTPVQPALHYIAVTAQIMPGKDGKHRLRMPDSEIQKVLKMAEKIDAIVFLDLQVGFSTLSEELPPLREFLKLPNVHLGIDPEFSMKGSIRPGKVVGTYDAEDINYAAQYLAEIVRENDLPPKILVVHRYTQRMVTNYQDIKPLPEVQIVMHMDGWGPKAQKKVTYRSFIYSEPVQFAGFKIFYKNDVWNEGTVLFEPRELLELRPIPIYIQYQ